MPGLIRGVARTAAIAGTATAVSNRVSRRQAGRWAAQEQQAYQQPASEQAPPAAGAEVGDQLAQAVRGGVVGPHRASGGAKAATSRGSRYAVMAEIAPPRSVSTWMAWASNRPSGRRTYMAAAGCRFAAVGTPSRTGGGPSPTDV